MAKELQKGLNIDLSNPEDPFRLILEGIVNAYATDFENVDDPQLKPIRKIAPGIIDKFGKLENVPLPYGDDSNKKLTQNSAVRVFEQLGLIKNNPVKAGKGKLIDSYDFTPLMDDVIAQTKTGQLPSEALQSAIPDLRPTPVKATAGKRKVGQASAAVLENMPDTDLAKDAQKFLEDKGRIAPTPEAEPTRLTAREVLDKIYSTADEDTELERNRAVSEERATRSLLGSSLSKSEDVARNLSAADPSAMEKMGQFLNKNKGKIVKSVAPAVVGGAVGLAAKGAEALDYAMSSKPTGRDPESLSTEQMKALKASIEGGDLTDEQRLATSEFPPEVRDAEYLTKQIAKKEQPMKQGAEMQGDLERTTRFQAEMRRLMEQQRQKQGTAQ
jgi:hypothetical protein